MQQNFQKQIPSCSSSFTRLLCCFCSRTREIFRNINNIHDHLFKFFEGIRTLFSRDQMSYGLSTKIPNHLLYKIKNIQGIIIEIIMIK